MEEANLKISKIKINIKVVKFVFLFIISLSILYFLSITFESYIPLFSMRATTKILYTFLNLIGIKSTVSTYQLIFSNFSIEVVRQCTGIFEVIAISSCILAFPTTIKKKIIGIGLAIPTIYFFNMGRLVFLSLLGIYYSSIFGMVHDYILQLTFLFLVILYWMTWINKVVRKNEVKTS